jgi:hypothetical protein
LRSDARDVAQALINVGAGQKAGEMGGKVEELEGKVRELTEQLESKETELTDARAKVPDAASLEEAARKKWEPKLGKEKERADKAEANLTNALTQIAVDKAIARLITPNEQGMRADPEYANLIAAEKIRKQITVRTDGTLGVKQLGEDGEYDGESLDDKVSALVNDFRPTIPSTFVLSNADSGAGIRNGGGGSGKIAVTEQQLAAEMRQSGRYRGTF